MVIDVRDPSVIALTLDNTNTLKNAWQNGIVPVVQEMTEPIMPQNMEMAPPVAANKDLAQHDIEGVNPSTPIFDMPPEISVINTPTQEMNEMTPANVLVNEFSSAPVVDLGPAPLDAEPNLTSELIQNEKSPRSQIQDKIMSIYLTLAEVENLLEKLKLEEKVNNTIEEPKTPINMFDPNVGSNIFDQVEPEQSNIYNKVA